MIQGYSGDGNTHYYQYHCNHSVYILTFRTHVTQLFYIIKICLKIGDPAFLRFQLFDDTRNRKLKKIKSKMWFKDTPEREIFTIIISTHCNQWIYMATLERINNLAHLARSFYNWFVKWVWLLIMRDAILILMATLNSIYV